MKQQFQDIITEQVSACYPDFEGGDLFGGQIKPILINSALLSAQNRQRYYWTNIPNIEQPEDKGIVLRDILEDDVEDHYLAGKHLQNNYQGGNQLNPNYKSQANTIHDTNKKSGVICAGTHGYANGYVISAAWRGRYKEDGTTEQKLELNQSGKSNSLTTVQKDSVVVNDNLSWRKLTPLECERLQTVPDNYTNHVSNTQRYKMLGNGWTVEVIAHILNNMKL